MDDDDDDDDCCYWWNLVVAADRCRCHRLRAMDLDREEEEECRGHLLRHHDWRRRRPRRRYLNWQSSMFHRPREPLRRVQGRGDVMLLMVMRDAL